MSLMGDDGDVVHNFTLVGCEVRDSDGRVVCAKHQTSSGKG